MAVLRTDATQLGGPGGLVVGAKGPQTMLFAVAVGVVVLSLFASQPLVGLIGPSLGLDEGATGAVTTLTLLGYASGLFFLTPLTDLVENRALIVRTLFVGVVALGCVAIAPNAPVFLAASFVVGMTTSAIQMLVPVVASLAPEAQRGRVVGNVMSGLMLGILLSRPAASMVAELAGWRWFYGGQAILVAIMMLVLWRMLPRTKPQNTSSYLSLIISLPCLLREEPVLKRRAIYQALCMVAFGIFWTAVALRLAEAPFHFSQTGIALFALAGAAGVVIAPIAGRAGDMGWTRPATALAHFGVIAAMGLAWSGGSVWPGTDPAPTWLAAGLMVVAAVMLDLGVIADQTLGRRAINLLRPEARGRLNGLFTGIFFIGASIGSALSGIAWVYGGWSAVCLIGAAFGLAALGLLATEQHCGR